MALTGKKRLFAEAVLARKSNKDAAIAAGYSPATASQAGSRLVKDKDVVTYLAQHRKKPAAKEKAATKERAAPPTEKEAVTQAAVAAGFALEAILTFKDPKDFLLAAMNDQMTEPKLRVTAAQTLMPFFHPKLGEGGKKDAKTEAAKKAASKFGVPKPPLKLVNGK
ncbi:terminase small subunit [Paraburkholderia sp. CNPSo 3157]|uniref:Terminase small subunit n=1 Tax=Paraburkholderia franconis TaxID=2654983 RepID=A0A7X1N9I4_9BURK|nr:terminase small subunit [Paraburkholderia franconis]MPW17887.1 terminase small subunit [Paraburkholderia franconis]